MKNIPKIPVIDLHADTFMHHLSYKQNPLLNYLHFNHKGDFIKPKDLLSITPETLQAGNVKVQAQSLFIDSPSELAPLKSALQTIALINKTIKQTPTYFAVDSCQTITDNLVNDKTGMFITIEGLEVIEGDLDLLDIFYDLGVRIVGPTWNRQLPYNAPVYESGGILAKGKELVEKLDELGMILDISHCSDQSSFDYADLIKSPIIATHSNIRALNSHKRNLSDDQLMMLQERDGVFGINLCPYFIKPDKAGKNEDNGFEWCWQIIDYAASKFSLDMVAIGTDFDGIASTPKGMENPSFYPKLIDFLLKKGMKLGEIEKVFFRNAMRVLQKVM